MAYQWVVPFTDWWVVDTEGSDYDTVLSVHESACGAPFTQCNNDASGSAITSRVVRRFIEGDEWILNVDGFAGSTGNAVLNINPVTCPGQDLNGVNLPENFTTVGGSNAHGGDCGGEGVPEKTFRFTPDSPGLWRFSALGIGATPIVQAPAIYLENGPICGSPEIACNARGISDIDLPSSVVRYLDATTPVTVIVEGLPAAGPFSLDAEKIADTCPLVADPSAETMNISNFPDQMTSTCGSNAGNFFGSWDPSPDIMFEIAGAGSCSLNTEITASFAFSVALIEGACTGPEVSCELSPAQPDGDGNFVLVVPHPQTELDYTLVISPTDYSGMWLDGMVSIQMFGLC
jgi:hypothetical protein